jgi:hypothetical protein
MAHCCRSSVDLILHRSFARPAHSCIVQHVLGPNGRNADKGA